MAYATTPQPGDAYLCAEECRHVDCAEHRAVAAAVCPDCTKPIGHGAKYMQDAGGSPHHAECLWKALEAII